MLVEKGEGQMSETEPTIQATDEQVEFFCREGYLSIERITTGEEVERMRAAYDEIFEPRRPRGGFAVRSGRHRR